MPLAPVMVKMKLPTGVLLDVMTVSVVEPAVLRDAGLKLLLEDGSWVCYRVSGTEPVVRVYTEARSEGDLRKLSAAAKDWVLH